MQWKIEFYHLPDGNSPVLDWFQEQEDKVKARLSRVFDLLQESGISVGMPHVRSIGSKLYEIRAEQDTNTYRILYFAYTGQRFMLLHGFQKKTEKTPKKELEIAENRLNEFLASEKQKQPNSEAKSQTRRQKK